MVEAIFILLDIYFKMSPIKYLFINYYTFQHKIHCGHLHFKDVNFFRAYCIYYKGTD